MTSTSIAMNSYLYFALGATLLVGAGLFAIRREHHAALFADDDIDWL